MIDALHVAPERVARVYSRRAGVYARTVARWEREHHRTAVALAGPKPGERVLEVAVGPGLTLVDLARAAGPGATVHGVDLSPGMLRLARQTLDGAGLQHVHLQVADARALPVDDAAVDYLYNAYMLDLIPFDQIPGVLGEFRRVLAPGGRLVLLNMSKPDAATATLRERLYRFLPESVVLYIMGGCRPVVAADYAAAAGFTDVERTFLPGKMPSEIVLARR